MEDLEEIHIEWVSPDGKMKQCYNVQTLIKLFVKVEKTKLLNLPISVSNEPKFEEQIEKISRIISKLKKSEPKRTKLLTKMISMRKRWKIIFNDTGIPLKVKYNWMSDIGDMYVCPLCFSYLSHLLDIENGDDNDDEMKTHSKYLRTRALSLVQWLGMTKQAEMRTHLSTVHKIPKKYLTKKLVHRCPQAIYTA